MKLFTTHTVKGVYGGVFLLALMFCADLNAANQNNGRELFNKHCLQCHMPGNAMPGSPDFARAGTLFQADSVLLEKIRKGVNAMPGFNGLLRNREILDIIAYMRVSSL